jgi:hypothetical protein
MFSEILTIIIAYLGIFVGLMLSKIASEEVAAGKKNLIELEHVVRLLVLIGFFLLINTTLVNKIILFFVVFVVAFFVQKNYYVFGFILGLNPDLIMSSLIFIYGFPRGSLMQGKTYSQVFKKTWLFLVMALLGILVRNFVL